jgi:hypothetical protein
MDTMAVKAWQAPVLEEADRWESPHVIRALLRREGPDSSHLTTWGRGRQAGSQAAVWRGRKAKLWSVQRRVEALERLFSD